MSFPRRAFLLLALACGGLLSLPLAAQDVVQQQNQIKLAYLFHFLQHVRWPNEDKSGPEVPMVIGLVGHDPFGDSINVLASRKVRGRSVQIKRFVDAAHLEPCQILFVGTGLGGSLPDLFRRNDLGAALTVSDLRDFVDQGGMVGFVLTAAEQEGGTKVRFAINLEAARRKDLQVSSKLLELATQVRQ